MRNFYEIVSIYEVYQGKITRLKNNKGRKEKEMKVYMRLWEDI